MTDQATQTVLPELALDTMSFAEGPSSAEESPFLDFLTQLARQKWIIARFIGAAVLLGIVLCIALPVRYTASTKIMPPQQSPSSAMMMMNQMGGNANSSLATTLAGGALGLKNPSEIYVGLLKSRPIANAIIQKFDLAGVYRSRDMTAARKKLADFTEVASDKTGIISVSVTDSDRQRAAGIANEYVAQLRILTKDIAVTEAGQRRLFYDDQIKSAKESLVVAEDQFQKVQQARGIIHPEAQTKAMIETLALLRAEVTAKTVELQALRSFSTDRNPEVELTENQLASMKAAVARLEQNSNSAGFTELGLKDVPGAGLEYLSAQHEVVYRQTLFDLLIKQSDIARLDEAKEAAIIQTIEHAIPPDRKSEPERSKLLFLSVVFGFLAGCVYSYTKTRIQESPETRRSLGDLRAAFISR